MIKKWFSDEMLRLKSAICEFENEWLLTFRKATKVVISWYLGEWVYVETKKCVSEYEINKKRGKEGGWRVTQNKCIRFPFVAMKIFQNWMMAAVAQLCKYTKNH